MTKCFFCSIVLFSCAMLLFPESTDLSVNGENKSKTNPTPEKRVVREISGYRGIELGMTLDTVKKNLQKDPLFNYRGDPDVMFTPDRKETIIECSGNSFIQRGYFQFNDNKLFIMTIVLNPRLLDYFTMFTTLSNKYGDVASLDPDHAIWIFPEVRMSLEKPLSVKYIAIKVFEKLKEAGVAEERFKDIARDKFLEEF